MSLLFKSENEPPESAPFLGMHNDLNMYPEPVFNFQKRLDALLDLKAPQFLAALLTGERVQVDGETFMLKGRTVYSVKNESVSIRAFETFEEFLQVAEKYEPSLVESTNGLRPKKEQA
jgi:hypothetical protein